MGDKPITVNCPTCRRPVTRSADAKAPFFPFCSARCKALDLAGWFDGSHRIEEPVEGEHKEPPEGEQ